jgi:hypothetical protein
MASRGGLWRSEIFEPPPVAKFPRRCKPLSAVSGVAHFRRPQTAADTPIMIELGFEVDRSNQTPLGPTIETVAAAAIDGSLDL